MNTPLAILSDWLREAENAEAPTPRAMTLVTATRDGCPSARTVTLKRLENDALVFTTALWTRKAKEINANPQVALLFYWPTLRRQANLSGDASVAERALAVELFAERDLVNQLQTVVSHQGDPIDDLDRLRARVEQLVAVQETAPPCPQNWGAIRVKPQTIELWEEATDRLHTRRLFERDGERWTEGLISP
jgi:pyridoxamine 5'-phosphate oxidase